MTAWIAQHRKLIVAVIGGVITVAVQAGWTSNLWVSAAVLIATAAGVYRAPNDDPVTAPAAPVLPPRGGGSPDVRLIPAGEPQPVQERVAQPPPPGPGVPPSGTISYPYTVTATTGGALLSPPPGAGTEGSGITGFPG